MPQFCHTEVTQPVIPVSRGKTVVVSNTSSEIFQSLLEKGFACIEPGFTAPWTKLEVMMDRLEPELIERINRAYNEKKIIKSSNLTEQENIDRKVAFDISPDRLETLRETGEMERFPEFPAMLNYFSESEAWLTTMMAGLGDGFEKEKMKFNFRMISYQGGSGTCQPHRDFGLLTLIQQNGVGGLQVEQEGRMVGIPGTSSLLLAGWCLHLLSNGKIPAPLHQVSRPPGRRLSCVTFLAPEKEVVLEGGDTPLYRTIRTGDLKTMMAKRWRYREGTLQPSQHDQQTTQDDFVFKNLKI